MVALWMARLAAKGELFYVLCPDKAMWQERYSLGEHYASATSEAGHVVATPDGDVFFEPLS